MSAASTLVSFGGDGLPDTEWLGTHEKHARRRDEESRADALLWMMNAFDRYVIMSDDKSQVVIGSYRLFEFAVSLEEAKHYKTCARSAAFPDLNSPTYSEVVKDEMHACAGNFLALTQFAAELEPLGEMGRWAHTVPTEVPNELIEFVSTYLGTLSEFTEVPEHRAALSAYSRAMNTLISGTDETFAADAGRAHAYKVLLHAR